MKSHFTESDYNMSSSTYNSIANRKTDKWGYHKIKVNSHTITIYTGAGPVTGDGVVKHIFPRIEKKDKVLILSGSHGDPHGRTSTEMSELTEDMFVIEDAYSIANHALTLKASAINILDIDTSTTKEIDEAYLKAKVSSDDRQFDVVIAAFCFSEVRWNALNGLSPTEISFISI